VKRIVVGVGLQGFSILFGYLSIWLLYSGGWVGILVLSTPLFLASVIVLMTSRAPLWARLLLSLWPLIIPLTQWDIY
jgi:hypothetical protein